MKHIIFDTEVFAYDWLAVFRVVGQKKYTVIQNNNEELKCYFEQHRDDIFFGFNIKHYDNYIIKAIMNDADTMQVKAINDYIIRDGNEGYTHPWLKSCRGYFNYCDLMDDMQVGLSLKSIEAHLGMDIEESEVDFNLDRELTDEELNLTERYCKFDVDATLKLYDLRKAYLDNKIMVGRMAGLTEAETLKLTNGKLTAILLQAEKHEYNDERKYVYPANLKREYIPQEVFDFFDRMYDESLSDDEVFKSKLEIEIAGCPTTIAYGGIHSALPNYREGEMY